MGVVDFLFPKKCLGCHGEGVFLCDNCLFKLKPLKQKCPYCEKPSIDGATHIKCLKKYRIDGIYCLWPYTGIIRRAILKLKFSFAREIAEEISEHMFNALKKQSIFPKNSIFTPIPEHYLKQNFRGFNQSDLIAKKLCREMSWNYEESILERKLLRKPQAGLSEKQRKENIRGVFNISRKLLTLKVKNNSIRKTFILFDDVCTTGSTLKEAAKTLKRSGASCVWGLTIAG